MGEPNAALRAARERLRSRRAPGEPLSRGELADAVNGVREAVPLVDTQRPGRLVRKLGDWHREAATFASVPAVRETRRDIADLTAAAV